jgi:diguanylate cyclase (GGDEF)-like protein
VSHKIKKSFIRSHRLALLGGLGVFLLVATIGEMFVHNRADEAKKVQFRDSLTFASKLRAQVESELNSLLYLSSGLGSYLIVRNDHLKQKEVNDILSVLHKSSRHIRNFGIAVGYTIKYVYPLAGNEAVIGLYYPNQPQQWPAVKKCVESGAPTLAGPVNLIQGGRGLIYRAPLFRDKGYWGMLSTVINLDSLAETISTSNNHSEFSFAIRGSEDEGAGMILGDESLFNEKDLIMQDVSVPGGSWHIAVKPVQPTQPDEASLIIRLLFYFMASVGAWMMYLLIRSRFELSNLAMYDQLTGLPNRHLLEDRAEIAFARQQRRPEQKYAVLFLDLDGFKEINDRFGHKAGDAVLLAVAHRASSTVRGNDTVARWGGDEFIVLMEDVEEDTLPALIERMREEIEQPIKFEDKSLRVGVSIGMALHPQAGGSLAQLLREADHQMYEEKRRRKSD